MNNPLPEHSLLKGSVIYRLPIANGPLQLRSYSDSDWTSGPSTHQSTTGHYSFLGWTFISWTVKKQSTVAHSIKVEYRALAAATANIIWLWQTFSLIFILNLLYRKHNQVFSPSFLYCLPFITCMFKHVTGSLAGMHLLTKKRGHFYCDLYGRTLLDSTSMHTSSSRLGML